MDCCEDTAVQLHHRGVNTEDIKERMNTRWMPTAAGILDLLCCLLLLLPLLLFLITGMIMFVYYPLLITLSIAAGFFAFIGGINTLNRRSWWKALVGSLAAVLIFLPLLFLERGIFLLYNLSTNKQQFPRVISKSSRS